MIVLGFKHLNQIKSNWILNFKSKDDGFALIDWKPMQIFLVRNDCRSNPSACRSCRLDIYNRLNHDIPNNVMRDLLVYSRESQECVASTDTVLYSNANMDMLMDQCRQLKNIRGHQNQLFNQIPSKCWISIEAITSIKQQKPEKPWVVFVIIFFFKIKIIKIVRHWISGVKIAASWTWSRMLDLFLRSVRGKRLTKCASPTKSLI